MDPFIDISNTTLESERLILRFWQIEDLSDFYEYASVPGVGEMAVGSTMKVLKNQKRSFRFSLKKKMYLRSFPKKKEKLLAP